jgi:DNA-binding GntR family transcriptional regulator
VTVTVTEHVRAATPNPDDSASLNLAPAAPVLVTRRIIRDTDDRPIAMEETRRSGEDTQLTYTIAPASPLRP